MQRMMVARVGFDNACSNLRKAAVLQVLLGLALLYVGFWRYSAEETAFLGEFIIVLRLLPFMLFYLGLKCFLIFKHLRNSVQMDADLPNE